MPGEMLWLNLLWDLGLAWHVLVAAVGAGSTVTAIQGCVANDGSASATAACVFGIASTIVTIGSAYQAMQAAGWFAPRLQHVDAVGPGGNRSGRLHQARRRRRCRAPPTPPRGRHPPHPRPLLRTRSRAAGPRWPHPPPGPPRRPILPAPARPAVPLLTPSARPHGPGRARARQRHALHPVVRQPRPGAPSELPARAAFQSSLRRPLRRPPPDAAYDDVLDAVSCFAGGEWRDGHVLSVQMYDNTHHATFGYASLGILENGDADADLKAFGPTGMPLPVPDC